MSRAIRTATILDNDDPNARVRLELRKDDDAYRWYTGTDEDTEISAPTVVEAMDAAIASWGYHGSPWKMRASWLR